MTTKAYTTIKLGKSTDKNGHPCLKGVCDITSEHDEWLGFFTAFGYTQDEVFEAAYGEADMRCKGRGYRLETCKFDV